MSQAKFARDQGDHSALGADEGHAGVHEGNITPTEAGASTNMRRARKRYSDLRANPEQARMIREARIKRGMTQKQVADQLGVNQSAVSQWEKGKVGPELQTRIRLAHLLRMPLNEVLPETTGVSSDVLSDPQVLRLVGCFVRLPANIRAAIELFVLDLEERHRSQG